MLVVLGVCGSPWPEHRSCQVWLNLVHNYGNKGHNSLHVELLLVPSFKVPLDPHVGSTWVFMVVLGLNIDPAKFG